MTEDHELDSWREQWVGVELPSTDFRSQVRQRIKIQDRRFLLDKLLTAVAFVGMLIFAAFLRREASWLGTGWASGLCVLVFVSVGYRLWILRGTWRAETQSIHGFLKLWHRRVLARIRMLHISMFVALGWIIFCAALTAANWATIRVDVRAHPRDWFELMVASVLMQPVLWFWARWLRRRKLAELKEVNKLLQEIKE